MPKIRRIFAILDPKTFPAAISPSEAVEERTEIVSSGKLVVRATKRNPTAKEEILKYLERFET